MNYKIPAKSTLWIIALFILLIPNSKSSAQTLEIEQIDGKYKVTVKSEKGQKINAPPEGLWSIATEWAIDKQTHRCGENNDEYSKPPGEPKWRCNIDNDNGRFF